ncbi:MAG: alpha-glucosidase C-terminal domain-containing protein, partial [Chloroflexi bacterium]|nr:alpha-glucosidase C-terminal domain-containing protein [Chloroflexota bacterium]
LETSSPDVLAYLRSLGDAQALVVVNFSDDALAATVGVAPGGRLVAAASTHLAPPPPFASGGAVHLGPLEAAVFVPEASVFVPAASGPPIEVGEPALSRSGPAALLG